MNLRQDVGCHDLDHMSGMMGMYDFGEFIEDLQEVYKEEKRREGQMTERTKNVLGDKFSLTFQNKYAQLSTRFDSLIEKAQLKFDSHVNAVQDLQQPLSHLLTHLNPQSYSQLLSITSHLLLSSQSLYHQYIKQQVFTIKQQLETIVIKNYQLQQEITNAYELYQQMKEKLDEEVNYRYQLEKHAETLEKEIAAVREENYSLNKANKSLMQSKHDLDAEVQVTKLEQRNLKKSQLLNFDQLKQQQFKIIQLSKQNESLHHQILSLRQQLQQAKFQQQNFIQQINHLKESIDNQIYELEFYKNRQLRESPSNNKLHSHDKLNKYQDLVLQNYQPGSNSYPAQYYNISSQKSSLRSFMLSHQKSMGKLTIFQSREQEHYGQNIQQQQRLQLKLQKVSSCENSLHSFERENVRSQKQGQEQKDSSMRLGFSFPIMNQLTFRPGIQNYGCNQKQGREDKIWTEKRKIDAEKDSVQQEVHFGETQPQPNKKSVESPNDQLIKPRVRQDFPYIEPLVISGSEDSHERQRSQSITEGHYQSSSFSVSKKLIYGRDEIGDIIDDNEERRVTYNIDPSQEDIIRKDIRHRSSNVSFIGIQGQDCIDSQLPYLNNKRSNFYVNNLSRIKHSQSQLPPLRKNHIPRTSSKKQFHCTQPINIGGLLSQQKTRIFDDNDEHDNEAKSNRFVQNERHDNTNNKSMIKNKSQSRIISHNNEWQNRSETHNSVNRALIKKSIKAKREMNQLVEKLQTIEIKNDEYQQKLTQLQYKLTYYKQQLSKSSLQCINQKTAIQNNHDEIALMKEEIGELEDKCKEYNVLIEQKNNIIKELQKELEQVEDKYEERLKRVKQHCREFIEKKHQQELTQIVQCYQEELKRLKQNIFNLQINNQQSKSFRDFQVMTNLPNLTLVSSIINQTILFIHDKSSTETKANLSLTIQSLVYADCFFGDNKSQKHQVSLTSCSRSVNVLIDPQLCFERKLPNFSNTQLKKGKLSINPVQYSLHLHFSQHKSPFLEKKLLNTPSTANYASQKNHQPTPSRSQSSSLVQCGNSSSQQQLIGENESFHTVQKYINKSSSEISSQFQQQSFRKQQSMQSFFTCIQFSNESIIQMKKDNSSNELFREMNNQKMLSEDILVVAQNKNQKSLFTSSQIQKDYDLEDALKDNLSLQPNKTETKQQSSQLKILNPSKISQFIQVQQPSITPHASSKHLKKIAQPYYKVTLPTQKVNLTSDIQPLEIFYSKVFEKHLSSYIKKHTNFLFSDQHFEKGFVPHVDKIYVLHCVKSTSQNGCDSDKENVEKIMENECFLLYHRLLVNLQTGKKLQLPKSSMLKFITDESKLALGNFQITITSQFKLKVNRNNKRCFYMGTLEDGTWEINKLQEVLPFSCSHKK